MPSDNMTCEARFIKRRDVTGLLVAGGVQPLSLQFGNVLLVTREMLVKPTVRSVGLGWRATANPAISSAAVSSTCLCDGMSGALLCNSPNKVQKRIQLRASCACASLACGGGVTSQ